MTSKTAILDCVKDFLDKQDKDISIVFEEVYKEKVTLNTVLSLMVKKRVFSEEEFNKEMIEIRRRIQKQ